MRYIKLIFFFIIHYDCFILFSLWRKKIIKSSALKHVIIYKNTTCAIEKLSKIIIHSGSLAINKPWFKKDPFPTFLTLHAGSIIDVNGIFAFYPSSRITLSYNARLSLGSGYANMGLNLCCFNKISIGKNVAISENVTIRDSDNHSIVSHAHTQTSPVLRLLHMPEHHRRQILPTWPV